jgi:hypothetical protein
MQNGEDYQLLRRSGQTKQLEMLVTLLPHIKNEQLLCLADFKPCQDML